MSDTIEQNLQRLVTAKGNIATAITNKGGTVGEDDGFESFADDIATIPAGLADVNYTNVSLTKTSPGSQSPENVFTCDTTPTSQSNNPITSSGVYNTTGNISSILDTVLSGTTLITKSISSNGTYNASSDNADGYSEVTVAVPNTYSSSDNGKVVQNGSLVSQTSRTVTLNGTYDTTTNNSMVVNVPETYAFLFVTTETGVTITVSKGGITLPTQACVSGEELVFNIPENGTWTVSGSNNVSDTVSIGSQGSFYIEIIAAHIYGVSWDKSSSSTFTRTDESANFSNPNPYYSGMSGTPSSPFDNLMPWSGMTQETIDGNVLVRIPKFWYKITNDENNLKFQISSKEVEGFFVSPAHADRGDGFGERDYVYIGRYKCSGASTDTYKSQTGKSPKVSVSISTAMSAIHELGVYYWQEDFALFWTVRMLYLVEFADWDANSLIGKGYCGTSSRHNTGSTDTMPYHTGTNATSRTEPSSGIQYRWIEDLWGNVMEICDGITFSGDYVRIKNTPSTSTATTNYTSVGTRTTPMSRCITNFKSYTTTGFEWVLYPSSVYNEDYVYNYYVKHKVYTSGYFMKTGDYYNDSGNSGYGLFCMIDIDTSSTTSATTGCRLMYLPPNSNS